MNGAEAFLSTLKAAGARYLFGLPGSTEIGLLDYISAQDDIRYILCLHEGIATAMAEGYSRASGTFGIANVHATVGTANTLSMLMNAYTDQVPVVVSAGIKDSRALGTDVFCDSPFQITELLRQYTKWSHQVLDPAYVGRDLAKAIRLCQSPIQGPVFLGVPENYWIEPSKEGDAFGQTTYKQYRGDAEAIRKAVEILNSASDPVLMVGNEVGRARALEDAVAFAEHWNIPVVTEDGKSWNYANFPTMHPLYMGNFNHRSELIKKADVLISIGNRMFMPVTHNSFQYFSPGTKVIQIHSDANRISTHVKVHLGIVSEAKAALQDLLEASLEINIDRNKRKTQYEEIAKQNDTDKKAKEELLQKVKNASDIKVQLLVSELSCQSTEDAAIINEGVRSGNFIQQFFDFNFKRSQFSYNGGSLGWGLPAAMGVKLAQPEREVIAFLGDGSFLFTPQALWTAARYKIGVKVIICNNKAYMAVKGSLIEFKGNASSNKNYVGAEFTDPEIDYISVCKGFGVPALKVSTPDELPDKLHQLLSQKGPALLAVELDQKDMEKLPY